MVQDNGSGLSKVRAKCLLLIAAAVWIIAFFYSGLGCALTPVGFGFIVHYVKRRGYITRLVTKKRRLA